MANSEHFEWLKKGVAEWNEWRGNNPAIHPDLEDADLRGVPLRKCNLSKANLSNSKLMRCDLSGADLSGAILRNIKGKWVQLDNANLSDVDALNADFSNSHLSDAILNNAIFVSANLSSTNLQRIKANNVSFRNASLQEADFSIADLHKATFDGANLTKTLFHNAKLQNANLNIVVAHQTNFHHADMTHAKVQEAEFESVNFGFANLRGVDFKNAKVNKCTFHQAIADEHNFRVGQLTESNMKDMDFNVKGDENADETNIENDDIAIRDRISIPGEEEIMKLPRWAKVAFAARCARRIQPLFSLFWPDAPEEYIGAVERAITVAEQVAAVAAYLVDDAARMASAKADQVAINANGLSHAPCRAVAYAAYNAACISASSTSSDAKAITTGALNAMRAAAGINLSNQLRAQIILGIRRDYDLLVERAKEKKWDDESAVSPDVFDPISKGERDWKEIAIPDQKNWEKEVKSAGIVPSNEGANLSSSINIGEGSREVIIGKKERDTPKSQRGVPSKKEIGKLPRWARVAYAARCARRVQPLFAICWDDASPEHIRAVDHAIKAAEDAARKASEARYEVAEAAANDSAEAAGYSASDLINYYAVESAYASAEAVASTSASRKASISAATSAAEHAVNAAAQFQSKTIASICRDYDTLVRLTEENKWDDKTQVEPNVLGYLWPDGEPAWEKITVQAQVKPENKKSGLLNFQKKLKDDAVKVCYKIIDFATGPEMRLSTDIPNDSYLNLKTGEKQKRSDKVVFQVHRYGQDEAEIALVIAGTTKDRIQKEKLETSFEALISKEAQELLYNATQDRSGYIMKIRTMGGTSLQTNNLDFLRGIDDSRIAAKWEHAIEELFNKGFISERGSKGEVFAVTHQGYEYIDKFRNNNLNENNSYKHFEQNPFIVKGDIENLSGYKNGGSFEIAWLKGNLPSSGVREKANVYILSSEIMKESEGWNVVRNLLKAAKEGVCSNLSLGDEITEKENEKKQNRNSGDVVCAHVSDQSTKDDKLGFEPYVKGMVEFLNSPATQLPLTLSVEGVWGSGKSSFMKQLSDKLKKAGEHVVWFNAWRHDKAEAMCAAFALVFMDQLRNRWFWNHYGRKSLQFQKIEFRYCCGIRYTLKEWKIFKDILKVLKHAVNAFCWDLRKFYNVLRPSVIYKVRTLPGWKLFWLRLNWQDGIFAVLWGLIRAIFRFNGNTIEANLKKYAKSPDYQGRVSFIESFHSDFRKIAQAYAGRKKVFVFIDDVDRCEVPRAADLMQAINLLINDDPKLAFIVGMDREKVAAGLAVKFEKLMPYLESMPVKINETDEKYIVPPEKAKKFGYTFIEKFIQLPFALPKPNKGEIHDYIQHLCGNSKKGEESFQVEKADAEKHITTTAPDFGSLNVLADLGVIVEDVSSLDKSSPDSKSMEIENGSENVKREEIRERVDADDKLLCRVGEVAAIALENNPRRIKQFINLFRLRAYLASSRIKTENEPFGPTDWTLERLAKFVAIELRWPMFLAEVSKNPFLLKEMQEYAIGKSDTLSNKWADDTLLIKFLKAGCEESEKGELWNLSDVDIQRLMDVSGTVAERPDSSIS